MLRFITNATEITAWVRVILNNCTYWWRAHSSLSLGNERDWTLMMLPWVQNNLCINSHQQLHPFDRSPCINVKLRLCHIISLYRDRWLHVTSSGSSDTASDGSDLSRRHVMSWPMQWLLSHSIEIMLCQRKYLTLGIGWFTNFKAKRYTYFAITFNGQNLRRDGCRFPPQTIAITIMTHT